MTPEATIIHYAGQSSRKRSDKEILVFKAKATMIRRHFPAWQQPFARFLLGLWPWSRMASGDLLARLTGRRRFAEAAAHWRAVWERAGELAEPGYSPRCAAGGAALPPEVRLAWRAARQIQRSKTEERLSSSHRRRAPAPAAAVSGFCARPHW